MRVKSFVCYNNAIVKHYQKGFDALKAKRKKKKDQQRTEKQVADIPEVTTTAIASGPNPEAQEEHMKHYTQPRDPIVNWWLLVTTIMIAIIYGLQLRAMLESNKISRDSLVSVQRAFMAFKQVNVDRFKQLGGVMTWQINATWENVGSTAATGLIQHTDAAQDIAAPEGDVFNGGSNQCQIVTYAGPKMPLSTSPVIKPDSFIPMLSNPKDVATWTGHHYVWGWVSYRDIFPGTKRHVSEFCKELIRVRTPPTPDSDTAVARFSDCPRHNCADEDCDDYKAITEIARTMPPN